MDNQKTFFQLTVTLTLTFDPLTSKSIGFICWWWPIHIPSMRSLGQSVLKLLIGNRFSCKGHTDLDLWPTDLKINRFHLLVMTNTPTKYEVPGSKRSQVIDRKPFLFYFRKRGDNSGTGKDRFLVLARDTPSTYGKHFYEVISKSIHAWPSYRAEGKVTQS